LGKGSRDEPRTLSTRVRTLIVVVSLSKLPFVLKESFLEEALVRSHGLEPLRPCDIMPGNAIEVRHGLPKGWLGTQESANSQGDGP